MERHYTESRPITDSSGALVQQRVESESVAVEDSDMRLRADSSASVSSTTPASVHNHHDTHKTARHKRRSTRACDMCRKSKVRCSGVSPCFRCLDLGHTCEYLRVPKSRGRPRRSELPDVDGEPPGRFTPRATGRRAENNPTSPTGPPQNLSPSTVGIALPEFSIFWENHVEPIAGGTVPTSWDISTYPTMGNNILDSQSNEAGAQWAQSFSSFSPGAYQFAPIEISQWTNLITAPPSVQQGQQVFQNVTSPSMGQLEIENGDMMDKDRDTQDNSYSPAPQESMHHSLHESRLSLPGGGCPPMIAAIKNAETDLRYPVLQPLVPHLQSIIRVSEACDLLDYYFRDLTNSDVLTQPHSPYVLAHIFRKQSFLSSKSPRPTGAALLCAMLFISMQTSSLADLNATPSSKARLSKKLLNLSLQLLGPLAPIEDPDETTYHCPNFELGGDLDTVVTYLHLGTVISAGDFKGQSVMWWKSAAALALKLGLNQELENSETVLSLRNEELKEERRRTWWLIYICDRHIALCYNSPLMLPQYASHGLYLPLDEKTWQGERFAFSKSFPRLCSPCFKMTGTNVFGFFLPLMTILGEIINLHHNGSEQTHDQLPLQTSVASITEMLHTFEQSLSTVSALLGTYSGASIRVVLCYSNHLVHVLYILLYGKWDLISMLDDSDLWISSPQFVLCVQHAVAAAECISQILILDPGLNHMPYLWGIYLLHGSFILVLFAEKMETQIGSNEKVISACETALRGHEVCVATLNTEYQRDFRRVLSGTLQNIWGKDSFDGEKRIDNMRRSLLLYRWNKGGRGLAL